MSRSFRLCLLLAFCMSLCACNKKPQITKYRVPKESAAPVVSSAGPAENQARARMLGAILVAGEKAWFYKMTGDSEAVSEAEEPFRTFIKSIRMSGANKTTPEWTLPEGWQQQPGNQMRFATILVSAKPPLEISVIPLSYGGIGHDEYILANVNRWRGQLQLDPISVVELDVETEELKTDDGETVLLFDMTGTQGDTGMGSRPPFANPPFAGGRKPSATTPTASGNNSGELAYDVPEGWQPGKTGMMRKAAFQVVDGDQKAEITIIPLSASANDLLSNVNRWRGQVQLPNISAEELGEVASKVKIAGTEGDYVELFGPAVASPRLAILGAMVIVNERAWFITLKGPAELAENEKERFRSFVKSVRFDGTKGADDGE